MLMNREMRLCVRSFAVLLAVGVAPAYATTDAAGVYKGSYASDAAGGDYGSVTIVINDQGGTTCDFYSLPNGYDTFSTLGSVAAVAPSLDLSCDQGIGGHFSAQSDSSSVAGASISGIWTESGGLGDGGTVPTGTFAAEYVSALAAFEPASVTGVWQGNLGAFNIFPADAGLVVSFFGWSNGQASTGGGALTSPPVGTPVWLLADVGPTILLPGTPITLNLYAPAGPTAADPLPSTVKPFGSLSITFLDCHHALESMSGPTDATSGEPIISDDGEIQLLAGLPGAPGC